MALSGKHERFAQEYVVDLNATQAAIRAGYSDKSAHVTGARLLKNAKVAARITELQAELSESTKVTAEYVLSSIVDTMERCKQATPVLDRRGDPVMTETPNGEMAPAYTFNASGVFKGAELLMKHLGMLEGQGGETDDGLVAAFNKLADKLPG
ncbi:MAG: terminase small subunit [Verrucomicrobiota bacterium JB024]|nr:terminase small subunit [Verrucomicrobiota bacterium JB024]